MLLVDGASVATWACPTRGRTRHRRWPRSWRTRYCRVTPCGSHRRGPLQRSQANGPPISRRPPDAPRSPVHPPLRANPVPEAGRSCTPGNAGAWSVITSTRPGGTMACWWRPSPRHPCSMRKGRAGPTMDAPGGCGWSGVPGPLRLPGRGVCTASVAGHAVPPPDPRLQRTWQDQSPVALAQL